MNVGDSEILLDWAGESRLFRLGIGELRAVQAATNYGPQMLWLRASKGEWFVDEIRHVLLQGLSGGGLPIAEAELLLKIWFDNKPLLPSAQIALAVLESVLVGAPDDPLFKKEAAATGAGKKPMNADASHSQSSMEMPQSSDLRPDRSTRSRSGNGTPSSPRTRRTKKADAQDS